MTMQYDVKAASANASAQLVSSQSTPLKKRYFCRQWILQEQLLFMIQLLNSATGSVLWQTKTKILVYSLLKF